MKKIISCISSLVLLAGCAEDPGLQAQFDEEKWKTRQGSDYPYRPEMLYDLMNNQEIRKLKRNELLQLLGEPTRTDTNYLFYRIEQKKLGLLPFHTTTMVIHLTEDDSVEWVKIHK